jgi:ribosomal protein S27AE
MSIGAVLIGLAIVVLVAVAVADPVVRRKAKQTSPARDVSPADEGKAILFALRDLDFDYQTGKINSSDYRVLRANLLAEAAPSFQLMENVTKAVDQRTEDELPALEKATLDQRSCPQCGTRVGREHRYCSRCGTSLLTTCKDCGSPIQSMDKFCPGCARQVDFEAI